MRTTIDIESGLLKRLRNEAHRRGLPFKTLLGIVIRRGLEQAPVAPPPYECPTFSMGTPAAGLDLDKALALSSALEDEEVAREVSLRK
jgi:hypothetical protein